MTDVSWKKFELFVFQWALKFSTWMMWQNRKILSWRFFRLSTFELSSLQILKDSVGFWKFCSICCRLKSKFDDLNELLCTLTRGSRVKVKEKYFENFSSCGKYSEEINTNFFLFFEFFSSFLDIFFQFCKFLIWGSSNFWRLIYE